MSRTKTILSYVLIALIGVACVAVVWHYFKTQIILGLGWIALFILVFGAGWVAGRLSGRSTTSDKRSIEQGGDDK